MAMQYLAHSLVPFRVARVEDLTVTTPSQFYRVELTNLAAGKLVSAAHLNQTSCTWQCLVMRGTQAVGLCFFWADDTDGTFTNCLAVRDDSAGKWQQAIKVAEQLPAVKKRDYELRFLDMGLPEYKAVWLHGRADDIFIPLFDDGSRLKAFQSYSPNKLIRVWQPMAQYELKQPIPLD